MASCKQREVAMPRGDVRKALGVPCAYVLFVGLLQTTLGCPPVAQSSYDSCSDVCDLLDDCGELVGWTHEDCVDACEDPDCPLLDAEFWISCIEEYCDEPALDECESHLPECVGED